MEDLRLYKVRDHEGNVPEGCCGYGYAEFYSPVFVINGWLIMDAQKAGLIWRFSRFIPDDEGTLIATGPGRQLENGVVIEEFPCPDDPQYDETGDCDNG